MDPTRFDELTKALLRLPAGGSSRRQVLAVVGGALGVLGGVLGLGESAAKKAKKKKKQGKKKKQCQGEKKRCGKKCIPRRACCTSPQRSQWLPEGGEQGQCGICIGGTVSKDPVACVLTDPDGCTDCEGDSFTCVPAPDGTRCGTCGTCRGGLCDPDATRACGDVCSSAPTPICVDPSQEQCCTGERACDRVCCQADSGLGQEDGEVCTRDGCCPQVKAASNCRADDDSPTCNEKICCDQVWTQAGRGLACHPVAGVPPETRAYCCGPGKSCCFTGCCPDGSRCCGDGQNCCPDGDSCGSASCFAPTPDHV